MSFVFDSRALDDLFGVSIASGIAKGIPTSLLGIAGYVLTALALYAMAKRRGLNHPWLAWIPVARVWLLGSLSDQYRYVVRGENKSKRKVLLVLSILSMVLCVAMIVCAVAIAGQAVFGVMGGMNGEAMLRTMMGPLMGIVGLCLPLLGVAIAYAVIYYMALYDVFKSLDPGNCVLFLVLSILFHVTEPFFLFFNRDKDQGMPPRRPNPGYIPPEQNWQEPENKDFQ